MRDIRAEGLGDLGREGRQLASLHEVPEEPANSADGGVRVTSVVIQCRICRQTAGRILRFDILTATLRLGGPSGPLVAA